MTHTIILRSSHGEERFPTKLDLDGTKLVAEIMADRGEEKVSILTGRGTTWRLTDGGWIHDTGRRG